MEKRLAVEIQTRTKQEEREREKSQSHLDAQLAFLGEEWAALARQVEVRPLVGRRRRPEVGKWRVATEEKTGEMEVASPGAQCAERGSICLTWWFFEPGEVRSCSGWCRCDPLFFLRALIVDWWDKFFPFQCPSQARGNKTNKSANQYLRTRNKD